MEKTISLNGTDIAIIAEALDWLLDTDRTLTGGDRLHVERLRDRIKEEARSE